MSPMGLCSAIERTCTPRLHTPALARVSLARSGESNPQPSDPWNDSVPLEPCGHWSSQTPEAIWMRYVPGDLAVPSLPLHITGIPGEQSRSARPAGQRVRRTAHAATLIALPCPNQLVRQMALLIRFSRYSWLPDTGRGSISPAETLASRPEREASPPRMLVPKSCPQPA